MVPQQPDSMVESWGRVFKAPHAVTTPAFLSDSGAALSGGNRSTLALGCARSYGDVCLNDGRLVIRMHRLDRTHRGRLGERHRPRRSGPTLDALLRVAVPKGWFLPVTPGTKFVTLGGAVANDVHGKNHESAGTFGCHVRRIGLAALDRRGPRAFGPDSARRCSRRPSAGSGSPG